MRLLPQVDIILIGDLFMADFIKCYMLQTEWTLFQPLLVRFIRVALAGDTHGQFHQSRDGIEMRMDIVGKQFSMGHLHFCITSEASP